MLLRYSSLLRGVAFAILLALSFSAAAPAQASEASDRLVALGLANLKSGQFVVAAKYFNGARQVDKKDARALFYLGVALNRLGQHGAALESFKRMRDLKLTHRQLGLEAGWAAIAQGRTGLAINLLEPYVQRNPKNAKAREFLGRAYIGDGRLDEAELQLKAAMELDPKLKPTSSYYLGNIAAARGDAKGVDKALVGILEDTPESNVGTALQSQLRRAQAAERRGAAQKPWSVFGSFSVGRNSNVIALGDGIIQPSDISSLASPYALYEVGGRYRWNLGDDESFLLGGGISHQRYSQVNGQNYVAYNVFTRYTIPVTETVTARIDASGAFSNIESHTALRSGSIRPSVVFPFFRVIQAEVFVGHSNANYRSPTSSAASLDRDSVTRDFGGQLTYPIELIKTSITGGYTRSINDADGGDFDYVANRLNLGTTTGLPHRITASLNFSVSSIHYDNLNSQAPTNPAGPTGFGFARKDTVRSYGIRLSRPFYGGTVAFAQFQRISQQSNIAAFDYTQDDVRLGITATF